MTPQMAAPPFPIQLVFPDVEPELLEREQDEPMFAAPWPDYLRRVLTLTTDQSAASA